MSRKGIKYLAGACLFVAAVLAATNLMSRQWSGHEDAEEKSDVIAENRLKKTTVVPPMDADVPARTETATFALG